MHDVLLVDEIVRRIADHLFDSNDKSSSLAFSLCCRSLNHPVLDVLWNSQTDLVTLFKTLPPDLWEVTDTAGLVSISRRISTDRRHSPGRGPNRQKFLRSPTPDEWTRFRVYAQRMTKVYAPQNEYAPSEDILHLVNLYQLRQPLMPRLQLLNWTTGRTFLPWLHLLLSPSLSDVHIDFNGRRATPVNVAVIKALPTTYLKRFAFSTLHTNTEVDAALLDLVLKSRLLASIYIQQENNSEGGNPSVNKFDNKIEDEQGPIELQDLKSVIVGFNNKSTFLPSLFGRVTLPRAQQIYLQHTDQTEWLGPDDLFDSMLRSASPGILQALRYISHYHGMDITSARIRPLLRFVALRTVRVTSACNMTRCKFFLSDDDVSAIATSMPNLTELHLGGIPCMSTSVDVSMDSLAILAANCTKLRDLQIHFDAVGFINRALDVPNEHIAPPQLTPNSCQLTQLNVGTIPLRGSMEGYWVVGMALLQIFPNLKNIKYHQQPLFGGREWGEVARIIKVQRNVAKLMSGTSDEFTFVRVSNTQPV